MRIARYEKRLFAYLFDYLLAFGIVFPLFIFAPIPLVLTSRLVLAQLASMVVYSFLTTLCLWISNGYTFGSMIRKIRVVRIDESKISLKVALIRSLSLSIFIWALINALNMLIVHTERTIFDRLSNTLVIDRKCY